MRLPPDVNRVLYVRNLPYKITPEEMYDIFGKYGTLRQIRVGNKPETRGTVSFCEESSQIRAEKRSVYEGVPRNIGGKARLGEDNKCLKVAAFSFAVFTFFLRLLLF